MTGQSQGAGVSVGIDIGGTFTDVICVSPAGAHILKVPSTRANPSKAVGAALVELERRFGIEPREITRFAHGTTVATNAVLERKGARVGIVTTEGFKDVLELGRQIRRQMYDLRLKPETPGWLAPGSRRVEVKERVSGDGSVLIPLDAASVDKAVAKLGQEGVQSIAVCLLFSFLRPDHEEAVRRAIARLLPQVPVSLSCEVDPVFREYERTVVTAFDAYIKPIVDRYLGDMEADLAASGVPAPLQVMQSRGGLAATATARQRPVRLFLSGPAAGALGGAAVGRAAGFSELITIDVGGTSSDIALIDGGRALVKAETEIAGYAVRVPMLDVTTLGAGGGSIAWIDTGGGLRVGPQSAGADPGPACYGKGGDQATVTDASIVLGYLDPAYFAGGAVPLQPELSYKVIESKVAKPLGMSVEEAALGIHRIANAHMADGIRLVSVNRGYDPREFVLVPLGGAGGLHATALAAELEIGRVLVPRYPGVLAAAGLLAAPIEHEVSGSFHSPIASTSIEAIRAVLADLDAKAAELMQAERIDGLRQERHYMADIGYVGQSHFIEVPLDLDGHDPLGRLYEAFEAAHERFNGLRTGAPGKIVNLRAVHRAFQPDVPLGATAPDRPGTHKSERRVVFSRSSGAMIAAMYDRAALAVGQAVRGPAVIEQSDSTTLLPPGWVARVVPGAALLLERSPA